MMPPPLPLQCADGCLAGWLPSQSEETGLHPYLDEGYPGEMPCSTYKFLPSFGMAFTRCLAGIEHMARTQVGTCILDRWCVDILPSSPDHCLHWKDGFDGEGAKEVYLPPAIRWLEV